MAKFRTKTISYRRAVWIDGHAPEKTLEYYFREANAKLKKVGQRKFPRLDGQTIRSGKCTDPRGGGLLIHLVAATPGDHASTVPAQDDDAEDVMVGTTPAPAKQEYMDGDVFAFVRGNGVFICSTVLRDGAFATYCRQLFEKAKCNGAAQKFDLQNVANVDKIKLIKAQGVKLVEMRATLYEASTTYADRKADSVGAVGAVFKHLRSVFGKDRPIDLENVSVSLNLHVDNRKADRVHGAKLMTDLAKDMIEDDDDDYVIVTNNNQRISQKEVFVRTKVSIDRLGKSVSRDKAWAAIMAYEKQLIKSGIVAQ